MVNFHCFDVFRFKPTWPRDVTNYSNSRMVSSQPVANSRRSSVNPRTRRTFVTSCRFKPRVFSFAHHYDIAICGAGQNRLGLSTHPCRRPAQIPNWRSLMQHVAFAWHMEDGTASLHANRLIFENKNVPGCMKLKYFNACVSAGVCFGGGHRTLQYYRRNNFVHLMSYFPNFVGQLYHLSQTLAGPSGGLRSRSRSRASLHANGEPVLGRRREYLNCLFSYGKLCKLKH